MSMTKLEAVNIALDAIGEAPVNTLSSGVEDAETAERMLGQVRREILAEGWGFNTRTTYLTRDTNNRFVVPGSALSIDSVGESAGLDVIAVGGYLYSKTNETNVWASTSKIRVEIVYDFEFEDLPYTLQAYIAHAAAVRFAKSSMLSVSLESMVYREYREAKIKALSDDNLKADPNSILDNPGAYAALYRPNRFFGY